MYDSRLKRGSKTKVTFFVLHLIKLKEKRYT